MSAINPTAQQRKHVLKAYDKLKNREMVYLAGAANGKTKMIQYATESSRVVKAKHPEDNAIRFVAGLGYGRSDQMTVYAMMRQILLALNTKPMRGHWNVTKQFEEMLARRSENREVICLTADNADLITKRSYTVFKHLNEIRVDQKDVGCAVLVAGRFSEMKMPIDFFYRCTELKIEDLYPADIITLINMHWPGLAREFDAAAVDAIRAQSPSLLDARRCLELVIREKHKLDMDHVTVPLVNKALALAA